MPVQLLNAIERGAYYIVHGRLSRVISQNTGDHDDFLSLCEPAFFAA